MSSDYTVLLTTTLGIAFIHTIAGPDHYLPFMVIARSRQWSVKKTLWFTALCGLGHVGSSIALGLVGVATGIAISSIELWEGQRGSIVSVLLLAFGFVYMLWGIIRAVRNKPHTHIHLHQEGEAHEHEHTHHEAHVHVHDEPKKKSITPWVLFTIFIFGPCEPLIPLVMYPAADMNTGLLIAVTALFAVVTIGTMMSMVFLLNKGISILPMRKLERYQHALAGFIILVCGVGMVFLGW